MAISIDDPRLVESFRAGENEAFEALMRAHRPALYRHAMRRLSDHASAEDAVQETFTRAYRSRARVGDDWRLSAWLHQILANVCIDEANRRRRDIDKTSRWAVTDMPTRGVAPDLDLQLGLDVDHSNVVEALQQLPDAYQEALTLRYVAEMEYDEIAEVLEVTEDNARARVSRASKAMRVLLRPVAAFIAFLSATLFRRGDKAAKALSLGDATATSNTVAANSSMYSSLVETAQAVAVQAPHAMPLISKAAIGIGAALVATSPATAPLVIDQFRSDESESSTSVDDVESEIGAPVLVETDGDGGFDGSAEVDELGAVGDGSDTLSPVFIPGETPTPEYGTESAIDAGVGEETVATVAPTPLVDSSLLPGVLRMASVDVVPSGARLDLSGDATLTVGDSVHSGALVGRISLMTDPDADGRQRVDGSITISTADGSIEILLAGYATVDDAGNYDLAGRFRSSGDTLLLSGGSFSGSLGTSFSLSFAS